MRSKNDVLRYSMRRAMRIPYLYPLLLRSRSSRVKLTFSAVVQLLDRRDDARLYTPDAFSPCKHSFPEFLSTKRMAGTTLPDSTLHLDCNHAHLPLQQGPEIEHVPCATS